MTGDDRGSRPHHSRTVLVTGGARGIGRAIVERYAKEGFEVIAPSRAAMDLASVDSVEKWVSSLPETPIDVLVNNAGENVIRSLDALSADEWTRMQTVNLTAPFLLIKALAPGMAARGWGRIVNVSSCYGVVGRAGRAAYSASKAGLNGLTRVAAIEYGERGVLVNSICPGFVATELTRQNNSPEQIEALRLQVPLRRLAQPAEIAEVVFFLGSAGNTYLSGQTILVDGGFTVQ